MLRKRLLALASEDKEPLRLWVQPLDGKPYAITPPTVARNVALSPDGSRVAVFAAGTGLMIYSTAPDVAASGQAGTTVRPAKGLAPLLWTEGDWLYVQHIGAYTEIPTRISRFHLPSGKLEPWKDIAPRDVLGVNAITKVMLSADRNLLVFNYRRVLSELFVAQPVRR